MSIHVLELASGAVFGMGPTVAFLPAELGGPGRARHQIDVSAAEAIAARPLREAAPGSEIWLALRVARCTAQGQAWQRGIVRGAAPVPAEDYLNRPLGDEPQWPCSVLMRRRKAVDLILASGRVRMRGDQVAIPVHSQTASSLGRFVVAAALDTPGRVRLAGGAVCSAELWTIGYVGPLMGRDALAYTLNDDGEWELGAIVKEPAR